MLLFILRSEFFLSFQTTYALLYGPCTFSFCFTERIFKSKGEDFSTLLFFEDY